MNTERIKQIQQETAYPNSISVQQALLKVWNECEQDVVNKNDLLPDVSGSLLSDTDYWKQRCLLAEQCLEESPCDPDITADQIKAWNAYHKFISWAGNDR